LRGHESRIKALQNGSTENRLADGGAIIVLPRHMHFTRIIISPVTAGEKVTKLLMGVL